MRRTIGPMALGLEFLANGEGQARFTRQEQKARYGGPADQSDQRVALHHKQPAHVRHKHLAQCIGNCRAGAIQILDSSGHMRSLTVRWALSPSEQSRTSFSDIRPTARPSLTTGKPP